MLAQELIGTSEICNDNLLPLVGFCIFDKGIIFSVQINLFSLSLALTLGEMKGCVCIKKGREGGEDGWKGVMRRCLNWEPPAP